MMEERSGEHGSQGAFSSGPVHPPPPSTSGSCDPAEGSKTALLTHRHLTTNTSPHTNHNHFPPSFTSSDDEELEGPLFGDSFKKGGKATLSSINSGEEDHLFISGGGGPPASSGNGVGSMGGGGGESSRPTTSQNINRNSNNNDNSSKSAFRLGLGIFVLIIVDVIWVASSELSFYLFHDEKFDKPFLSTYVKTSMFLIFLFGFVFWAPWYEQCQKADSYAYTLLAAEANANANNSRTNLNGSSSNNVSSSITSSERIDADGFDDTASEAASALLSPPAFVPINYDTAGSGNESDDSAHQRSVRFSKLAEVRHLSEHDAAEAFYARLSYQASLQAEHLAYRLANRLSPSQTAHLAVTFCLMWFVANYTYQLAVSHTQVGIVNTLSSSSSFFTLLLAAAFPAIASDKFTISKLISVLVSICGVGVVSLSDLKNETSNVPVGAIFALVSSFFYAAYLVFLRKKVEHEDKLDIPLFFGFVGLFNLLLLWPLFFVFNYTAIEVFEWPSKRQWMVLIVNGIIGTVFSEVLWLWGCFLTSSLIATLAISLTIPMSMVADVIFKNVSYSWLFYIGAVPMLFSFFAVTLLTHYENWDPLGILWKRVCKRCWARGRTARYQRVMINDHNEQQERLLEDDDYLDEEEARDEESRFGIGTGSEDMTSGGGANSSSTA